MTKNKKHQQNYEGMLLREDWRDKYEGVPPGLPMCPKCNNIIHKKKWTTMDKLNLDIYERRKLLRKEITHIICPACKMKAENLFEGEIRILKITKEHDKEIANMIDVFKEKAVSIDPQHRILEIKRNKDEVVITFTENQMAVRLAKKIKSAFKKATVKISHSAEPYEVSRVELVLPDNKIK